MPERSYDYNALDKVVEPYKDTWIGFDAELLVKNKDNVLLTDGKDNYALFEYEEPGVYYGHYLFTTRGVRTLPVAKELLSFFFETVPCTEVRGLTPIDNTGAIKLNKALGFDIKSVVDTEAGLHYEVSLTREEFQL